MAEFDHPSRPMTTLRWTRAVSSEGGSTDVGLHRFVPDVVPQLPFVSRPLPRRCKLFAGLRITELDLLATLPWRSIYNSTVLCVLISAASYFLGGLRAAGPSELP